MNKMESVYLNGSEDVRNAGHNISSAAGDIRHAAAEISSAFEQQQRWMDDWLERLKEVLDDALKPSKETKNTGQGERH